MQTEICVIIQCVQYVHIVHVSAFILIQAWVEKMLQCLAFPTPPAKNLPP